MTETLTNQVDIENNSLEQVNEEIFQKMMEDISTYQSLDEKIDSFSIDKEDLKRIIAKYNDLNSNIKINESFIEFRKIGDFQHFMNITPLTPGVIVSHRKTLDKNALVTIAKEIPERDLADIKYTDELGNNIIIIGKSNNEVEIQKNG